MLEQYKIAILMATYNGERFLPQQLDSIKNQTYKNWCLYVLDDGSSDNTWNILQKYQALLGIEKMQIFRQNNQGSCITFLRLVNNRDIKANYFAYADQDDIWDENKLERALKILTKQNPNIPQLYCARARLINEKNQIIGALPLKKRALSFQHALVQCADSGNSMIFNQIAREIVQMSGAINIPGNHDWWTYLAVSSCGGFLYYDGEPSLFYRIHDKNVVGFSNNYFSRYLKRFRKVLNEELKEINNAHIELLHKIQDKMTEQSKYILDIFIQSRTGNIFHRLYYLYKSKVFHQEKTGTMGLYVSLILKKN